MELLIILNEIRDHSKFKLLNNIQRERITAPNHVAWFKIVLKCFSFDPVRTINLIINHSIDTDFKPIFIDLLNHKNMKATDNFKNIISNHLNSVAEKDSLFAETLKKPNKNIDACITYILNTVQKSGCNGFADEEIFGMAMHYYDEDNIEVGKPVKATVVVNHKVDSAKEKMAKAIESREAAPEKKPAKKAEPIANQTSLF